MHVLLRQQCDADCWYKTGALSLILFVILAKATPCFVFIGESRLSIKSPEVLILYKVPEAIDTIIKIGHEL